MARADAMGVLATPRGVSANRNELLRWLKSVEEPPIYTDGYSDCDTNGNTYSYPNVDPNIDTDCDANTNGYANINTDGNAYCDANSYSNTN